jgi:signal transduction histidine kinase
MKVIDPACGMEIEEKDAFGTSLYKEKIYYFCSKECKNNFDKDPEALLGMKKAREKFVEKKKSEALEKMMDEVTHEVRNPITAIGGFVRRIYKRLPDGDPNKKDMGLLIEDVMRLENMINQLVNLKTMILFHVENVNINDIITDILKSFKKEFKEKSLEVKTELIDNLPQLLIDREKMTMALSNLIRNAIESMQKPPKVLVITDHIIDGHIELRISDTGKGIPEDKIKQIFDPFFTSKLYGPGLGLTFTQRIIQGHKGTISVKSELGKGTAFIIRLPLSIKGVKD